MIPGDTGYKLLLKEEREETQEREKKRGKERKREGNEKEMRKKSKNSKKRKIANVIINRALINNHQLDSIKY
jgi:hypothetical protein